MKKKCVYTALTGGYDKLMQPQTIDETYDYICFSNDIKQNNIGIWQIRSIPFSHKDNIRVSRYPKFHPHILLLEYEYSIYIDANNIILDDYIYKQADRMYAEGDIIGHIIHPFRNCVYNEIFSCMFFGLDNWLPLVRSLKFLLRNNFPRGAGLFENNLIFWSHHKPIVAKALNEFWEIYLKTSHRDQLSLRYAYYINNIHPSLILPEGEDMRNSSHIRRVEHRGINGNHNLSSTIMMFNRIKIKITRIIFMLMGYDLSHKKLHSK